jgi:putative tricarboxylic transport membrane protein
MRQTLGPLLLALLALPAIALAIDYRVWSTGMPGSGLVPLIGAGLLLSAAVGSVFAPAPPAEGDGPADPLRQAGYVGGLLALPPLAIAIGMLPALALFALSILYFVERTSKTTAVSVAVATGIGAWLLFDRLLSVPLPRSALW